MDITTCPVCNTTDVIWGVTPGHLIAGGKLFCEDENGNEDVYGDECFIDGANNYLLTASRELYVSQLPEDDKSDYNVAATKLLTDIFVNGKYDGPNNGVDTAEPVEFDSELVNLRPSLDTDPNSRTKTHFVGDGCLPAHTQPPWY